MIPAKRVPFRSKPYWIELYHSFGHWEPSVNPWYSSTVKRTLSFSGYNRL